MASIASMNESVSKCNFHKHTSSDEEIEAPPPKDEDRDAASAGTNRKVRQSEQVDKIIEEARLQNGNLVDLSRKGLETVPDSLLEIAQLQYLYLEGNKLTALPHSFFDCLPNLSWLDLRRNYLQALPSAYIGSHRKLRTLLLESNNLKTLPLELGLIPTLTGLNLANNPLEFPPSEIVDKGAKVILQFFRDMLNAKTQGKLPVDALKLKDLRINERPNSESSGSSGDWESHPELGPSHSTIQQRNSLEGSDSELQTDLVGPVPHSASLHKPRTYMEFRQKQLQRLQQAGAMGKVDKSSASHRGRSRRLRKFQEPLPPEVVEARLEREQHDAKVREKLEQQDLILQRRKDNNVLREWREETKKKQRQKYLSRMTKDIDYTEPVKQAPFGIDNKHLQLPTNEERIAQEIRATHERLRQTISPRTRHEMEKARAERDRELERRIKLHMIQMQERRRQPKGTPQQEMEAARRDLQIAERLQRELSTRRKDLEYRFQAFTGGV